MSAVRRMRSTSMAIAVVLSAPPSPLAYATAAPRTAASSLASSSASSASPAYRVRPSLGSNPTELFQIWLNLASDDKMVEPHFAMLWSEAIPVVEFVDERSGHTRVTVIAGALSGADGSVRQAPPPPPHSWATRPDSGLAIYTVTMDAGAS